MITRCNINDKRTEIEEENKYKKEGNWAIFEDENCLVPVEPTWDMKGNITFKAEKNGLYCDEGICDSNFVLSEIGFDKLDDEKTLKNLDFEFIQINYDCFRVE